jgi:hypothetical protein
MVVPRLRLMPKNAAAAQRQGERAEQKLRQQASRVQQWFPKFVHNTQCAHATVPPAWVATTVVQLNCMQPFHVNCVPQLTCNCAAVHRTSLLRSDNLLQPAGAQQRRCPRQQLRQECCRSRVQASSRALKQPATQLDLHHAFERVVQG